MAKKYSVSFTYDEIVMLSNMLRQYKQIMEPDEEDDLGETYIGIAKLRADGAEHILRILNKRIIGK